MEMSKINDLKGGEQIFRYVVQSCTWFGGRVLTMICGNYKGNINSQILRSEIRCSYYNDMILIKKQIKVILDCQL